MTRLANQSCRGTNTKCLEQRLRDRPIEIPARWKLNENDSQLVAEPRDFLLGHSGGGGMAAAVGLALVVCVTFGSVVGALLPLIIKAIGFDPAVSSGPFIASLVDVAGIVIYLKIAIMVLGAPHPP